MSDYSSKYRCVYVLLDPRNNEVFYVGQTCMPTLRLEEHIISTMVAVEFYSIESPLTKKQQRIRKIMRDDRKPELKIVLEGHYSFSQISKIETKIIKDYINQGTLLTNNLRYIGL